ncbi:protein NIM1-INTERACTING 1 [Malania oleifera]|uniref:protein NIM1-INTERACTING 1 n=1 Tax=Malania oleifera TaxID=397392 RepID=UPI0025AE8C1C|nr:protein NIM1-INTERACTING 1 [Malania oleifera]
MEGRRANRSHTDANIEEEEEEEEEKQKIDAFYYLIRNAKDARDRLHLSDGVNKPNQPKEEGKEKGKGVESTWIPEFKLEDFADYLHPKGSTSTMLPSSKNEERHEGDKKQEEELDLNLSL